MQLARRTQVFPDNVCIRDTAARRVIYKLYRGDIFLFVSFLFVGVNLLARFASSSNFCFLSLSPHQKYFSILQLTRPSMKKCRLHGAIAAIAPTVVFVFEREREKKQKRWGNETFKKNFSKTITQPVPRLLVGFCLSCQDFSLSRSITVFLSLFFSSITARH